MNSEIRTIKRWLTFFIVALVLSGITAIPLMEELEFASRFFPVDSVAGNWLSQVVRALYQVNSEYPYLLYGYDWLAFAHIILAVFFVGPYRDPLKNKWVIEAGILACLLVIPFALVAGHFRNIPFWWRIIDCGFGLIGLIPLLKVYRIIGGLEQQKTLHGIPSEYLDFRF